MTPDQFNEKANLQLKNVQRSEQTKQSITKVYGFGSSNAHFKPTKVNYQNHQRSMQGAIKTVYGNISI